MHAARVVVLIALALVLNHARCVAACIADPCTQAQQPRCHQHKAPETKMDRGCAFPAAVDAQGVTVAQAAAEAPEPVTLIFLALLAPAPLIDGDAPGSPPGLHTISVLRI